MNHHFKVFVVDDDPLIFDSLASILEKECGVLAFASAEACQQYLATEKPDMILLDIELPGMDGYAFSRQLKQDPAFSRIPLTFISSHETIDARIRGYDAGGEDFIVKPFEPEEVLRKLRVAQHILANHNSLAEQAEAAQHLSSLVLSSIDESGILLQFVSKLIAWEGTREVARGTLELLKRYGLEGVVQTRTTHATETISSAGTDLPLELSVMNHVRNLGRIFEFKQRGVYNFDRVTLMVNNLPLDSPEYCGRLRDYLSMAAQNVDSRLKAIETDEQNRQSQAALMLALESVSETLGVVRSAHQRDGADSAELMLHLQESLANSFFRLGLSERQESFIQDLIGDFAANMTAIHDRGAETQDILSQLISRLSQLQRGG